MRKDDEMRETPLITFAKADDSGCGTRDPGDLDYIVHSNALEHWLGNGRPESGDDVPARAAALAKELRDMADHLVRGTGPVAVSCEFARKRYAERTREATTVSDQRTTPMSDTGEPENTGDGPPPATIHLGDATWHDGPGWYWTIDDYPDDGSCGAFATRAEAIEHATSAGYEIPTDADNPAR